MTPAPATLLNADFSVRATVHAAGVPWAPSPMPGVSRRMLDRVGGEVARATSIVRYQAGSRFSAHLHAGGEEFLVLEGVFQDEHGDYPAGCYVRNPPGTRHVPRTAAGCTIFVKLWQFDPGDRQPVRVDTEPPAWQTALARPGVSLHPLFADAHENVRLERWAPGADIRLPSCGGIELLVLSGHLRALDDSFNQHSWLRLPAGEALAAVAGPAGCTLWIKTGHLAGPLRLPPAATSD